MSDLILHQYAASPFSEKVRALLGYKAQPYLSVEIPTIMPKPDLMALTGGYRRTPVMQRGADIYCDTALICELLEDVHPEPAVTDSPRNGLLTAAARWTDSEFFRACVGLVFQPRALAANPRFQDPAVAEAFMRDRADFTAGSQSLSVPLPRAEATFGQHLAMLNALLQTHAFLDGEKPQLVDFSTWHCCWFVARQEVLAPYFEPFEFVQQWMARMAEFSGAAACRFIDSDEAVSIAANAAPAPITDPWVDSTSGVAIGATVQVLATDYGFQPVEGELLSLTHRRISIARSDERAGRVHVHFPRYGFEVSMKGE